LGFESQHKLINFTLEDLIKSLNSDFEVAHGLEECGIKFIIDWSFDLATWCLFKKDYEIQVWAPFLGPQMSFKGINTKG